MLTMMNQDHEGAELMRAQLRWQDSEGNAAGTSSGAPMMGQSKISGIAKGGLDIAVPLAVEEWGNSNG
jgi:hypothetical protein